MQIRVKIFATLVEIVPEAISACYPHGIRAGTPLEIEMPDGTTLADLIDHLALPREKVRVVFVNGRAQKLDYCLEPEAEVGIFPPIGGG